MSIILPKFQVPLRVGLLILNEYNIPPIYGKRLLNEYRHSIEMLYIYEDVGCYSPLARVDTLKNKQTVFYFHCQPNGSPDALVDGNGDIQWQARFTSWGKTEIELGEFHYYPQNRDQNLRFQGQYLDRETGLHYNTFRYYDPDIGRFTQHDPIGLAGGLNLYQYAPNGLVWVDPWGWAKENTYEVIKYMGIDEVTAVKNANGAVVPHYKSSRIARWLNMPGANWNPNNEIYRVVYTINQKGMDILNNHVNMDKLMIGETGLPNGVLSKPNEIGARGIGSKILDEFNKEIKNARIEKRVKNKWVKAGGVIKC